MQHQLDPSMRKIFLTVAGIFVITGIFLFIVQTAGLGFPLRITNEPYKQEFSVTGEARIDAIPDTGYVDVGFTVYSGATADGVQNELAQNTNALVAELQKIGITKEDMKSTNYSVYPVYEEGVEPVTKMAPAVGTTEPAIAPIAAPNGKVTRFNGDSTLAVTIRNKELVSKVIETATNVGSNKILSTRYGIDKPEKYREDARNKAINNAKEQASKLSRQLGIRLGRITNMYEGGVSPQPYMDAKAGGVMMRAESAAIAPDLQEGTTSIYASVTLNYETH